MDTVCVSPEMFFAKSVKILQKMQEHYDEERLRGDLDFLYYSQFSAPAGQDLPLNSKLPTRPKTKLFIFIF